MNYLIVDDEPIAHQIIDTFSRDLPFLEKAGSCHDALEALSFLKQNQVDLLFLDIQMPKLSGFEFLRTLNRPPRVIVISAHAEYALEGFELDVVDYLLKPFDLPRFLKAVDKAHTLFQGGELSEPAERHETIFLKDGKKHHQVQIGQIAYVEACGNYSMVYLNDGKLLTQEKLTDLAARLPGILLRVHKSYLVARSRIETIEGDEIQIGGKRIPIGRVYKAGVTSLLQ